jgi:nucleotide-binding universal stress UspA family protein
MIAIVPGVQDRFSVRAPGTGGSGRGRRRPVLLATLSVPVDPEAERVAVESALETGAPLIVADFFWLPPTVATVLRGDLEAVRETAARAAARGVRTELVVKVCGFGPARGLVQLARRREVGLVVLGPDRRRAGRWRFGRAARLISERLDCLVWTALDG